MKDKIYAATMLIVIATFLIGCSKEPPKCGDESTIKLVKEMTLDKIDKNKNFSEEFKKTIRIENPLATAFDEKIKKYSCKAEWVQGEGVSAIKIPILYESQLNDKGKHLVSFDYDYGSLLRNFNHAYPPKDIEYLKKKEKMVATIYFSDQQKRFLMPEKRYILKEDDPAVQAKDVINALLDGSKTGLVNTFPAEIKLIDVKIDNAGIAYVNFTNSLTELHTGGASAELAIINSLTISLTENVPVIKKVKILVEGKELASIKGNISTREAFSPDRSVIIPQKYGTK